MKEMMIAATMAAAANMACATPVMAQAPDQAPASQAPQAADVAEAAAPAAAPAGPETPLKVIPLPSEPLPAAPREARVEEVIVTAQRREERAQDVPISMTVFNQEQLAKANVTNSSDLATYTPSLSINTRFGNENASFAIRGFTQDLRTTASVATYFAEVVAPRGQTSQNSGDGAGPGAFFDLQNVQVLKGPQGTLFGRNTTGGAVLIVPRKPSDHWEGYAELSGGDFDARRAQAVINVPLFSRFKLRFGVDRNERMGHLNNITHIGADDLGNVDYTAYRLSAVLNLTDSLENYTILSYTDSNTHGYTSRLFACNPNPLTSPLSVFTGPGCQTQLANQAATGQDGFYDIVSTIKTPITAIKEKRAINTTTWEVSDNLTLKNIVAYAHLHTLNGSDIFGTQFTETAAGLSLGLAGLTSLLGLPGLPITLPTLPSTPVADPRREFSVGVSVLNPSEPVTSQKTWVEEVQVQGRYLDDRLKWQSGAYYEHSMPDGFSGNNSAGFLSCQLSTVEGDPSQYNCFDPLAGQVGSVLVQQYKTNYLNKAVFAQASFDIFKQLSITGGIRYTWDKTEGYGIKTRYTFLGSLPLPPSTAISTPMTKSKAPTGLIELSYKPIESIMAYAKYVRGYRQGSVNLAADPGVDTFRPEKVKTYEIGTKTSFDGLVAGRFNVAAFYNDFTDMQLQTGYISPTAGTTTAIFNAGKARISGVEADGYFQLFHGLSSTLSYAYLSTRLLQQDDHKAEVQAAGGPIAGLTYTPIADVGDSLPFAPDHTVVASLNYRLPLTPKIGTIELGPTYVYTGKRRAAATSSSPNAVLQPFSLLNLNLNWHDLFGYPVDLSAFATNVLNEQYSSYISGTYNVLGFDSRMMGMPRMIGARLNYRFGAEAN